MQIATFTTTTDGAGRRIEYDDGVFSLEGQGPITAADVLEYDRQGQIEWAYAGLREWVREVAATAAAQATTAAQARAAAPARKRLPLWAVAVVAVVAVLTIGGCAAAVVVPMFLAQDDKAKESSVEEGLQVIQMAVVAYAVDNDDLFPAAEEVTREELGRYVDSWPQNPYTGGPMAHGTGPGDFTYTVTSDRSSYTLVGHGSDGRDVITVGY